MSITPEQIEEMRDAFRRHYNADLTDALCDAAMLGIHGNESAPTYLC